ncbi:MAG: hypothetical protein KIT69_18565, partial [Propionibacteriaceae bacterium]|nr:hypothetical protein [Propionibacteriaceae bacterium]
MTDRAVSATSGRRAARSLQADPIAAPSPAAAVGGPSPTALPWLAWCGVLGVMVAATSNVIVLTVVIAACVIAALAGSGDRRPLFVAVAGVAIALVAVWVLWSLLLQRGGAGGTVLWVLPAWNPPSGGSFGGPVTLTQLHYGLIRALRAAAITLMVGLLGQQVAAAGWLRLADAALGRGAGLLSPVLCVGDAYLARRTARAQALATGLRVRDGSGGLAELALVARQTAQDWMATMERSRSTWRGVVGLGLQVVLLGGWAVGVLPSGHAFTGLTAPELTVLWLAAAIAAGLTLHPGDAAQLRP